MAVPLIVGIASGVGLMVLRTQQAIERETIRVQSIGDIHFERDETPLSLPGARDGRGEDKSPVALSIDTSDWTRYENPKLGFAFLLPDYIEEGKADLDVYCLTGENVATFIHPAGSMQLCAFSVLLTNATEYEDVRAWLNARKETIEPMGITFFEKIRNLGGTWKERRLGLRTWTFVEEPEGPSGEASYTTFSPDGFTIVYVFLPDLLLAYDIHEAILSTFEFIE